LSNNEKKKNLVLGPVFASQIKNSGSDFAGWTSPFVAQILHPSPPSAGNNFSSLTGHVTFQIFILVGHLDLIYLSVMKIR